MNAIGSRAIQRHHGDDVIQRLGLHLHQVARHAAAFHLEDASGLSVAHQLK